MNRVIFSALLVGACSNGGDSGNLRELVTEFEVADFPPATLVLDHEVCTDERKCQFEIPGFAAVAPNGDVVVGGMAAQLTQTNARGFFVQNVGRSGNGPGEYRWVVAADFDSAGCLKIYDTGTGRLTMFDSTGRLVSTASVPTPPGIMFGAIVRRGHLYVSTHPTAAAADSVDAEYMRFNENKSEFEPILTARMKAMSIAGREFMRVPNFFDAPTLWDVDANGRIVRNASDEYIIVRNDSQKATSLRIVVETPRERVGKLDVERELARRRGKPPYPPGLEEQLLTAARNAASYFPAIDQLRAVSHKSIWVRRFAKPSADSATWDLFVDDRPAATIQLPANSRILAGTDDLRLLVMSLDELDVPRIGWYRVTPS